MLCDPWLWCPPASRTSIDLRSPVGSEVNTHRTEVISLVTPRDAHSGKSVVSCACSGTKIHSRARRTVSPLCSDLSALNFPMKTTLVNLHSRQKRTPTLCQAFASSQRWGPTRIFWAHFSDVGPNRSAAPKFKFDPRNASSQPPVTRLTRAHTSRSVRDWRISDRDRVRITGRGASRNYNQC